MPEQLKTLPRWAIFTLDLCFVAGALVVSRTIRFNFNILHAMNNILFILAIVLPVNAYLFYLFKSYSGIVRYTNMRDMFRLVGLNAIASAILFVVSFILRREEIFFLSNAGIAINFFITCFSLVSYRMLVRYFYKIYFFNPEVGKRIKIAIYDTSHQGLLAKRLVNEHPKSSLEAVAFLDDNSNKLYKKLEGLRIYPFADHVMERLQQDKVELILIAPSDVCAEKLNKIIEHANQYGINVRQMPAVDHWLDDRPVSEQLKDIDIADLLERDVITIHNEQITGAVRGKKVLVTGAAGSIGSELVRQLTVFAPALILICDRAESALHELALELKESFPKARIHSFIGNICEEARMKQLFEVYRPEYVFHAAAYKHVPLMEEHPSVAVINNVLGTKLLAELAVRYDVEKFVMISTDKAVNPTNVMGASKRIAEIYIQSLYRHINDGLFSGRKNTASPTRFITTRFGNVLGSNGSVIPRFQQQLAKGGPITVTHPEITRYFMTIPEACQLVIEAGVMGEGGEIFVFDMGQPVRIADLAHKMIRLSGKRPSIDIQVVYTGLRPGEKLYEELLSDSENTMPTYHDKIMIAQVREYDYQTVLGKTEALIRSAQMHYTDETVTLMKDLVPEFISNNSSYTKLDAKTSPTS